MKTTFLPLFPLNIVVYPGERLNLHIFEERYKQLIQECADKGTTFGIPSYINKKLQVLGTEVELVSIEKVHSSGEMDIKTRGKQVFRLHDFQKKVKNCLYPGGQIERMGNIDNYSQECNDAIVEQLQLLYDALGIEQELGTFTSFEIGHHVGFTLQQEYDLLKVESEATRQEMILAHLKTIVPVIIETERLKEKIRMNGHFKHIGPLNI